MKFRQNFFIQSDAIYITFYIAMKRFSLLKKEKQKI